MILDCSHLTEQELIDALSQLRCLKVELDNMQRKVRHLERIVERRKNVIKKLIDEGESWEDITRFVNPVLEMYQATMRYTGEYLDEYNQLTQFIYKTPDSLTRRILVERYINGRTWISVAFAIGEHDEQYPRRIHNRFISEYVTKHNDIH